MASERTTQRVTLGCGTLILIAIIVLFFSRSGVDDLEDEIRGLRSEVGQLKTAIDAQTKKLDDIERRLPANP